jgi:hypothetical protein
MSENKLKEGCHFIPIHFVEFKFVLLLYLLKSLFSCENGPLFVGNSVRALIKLIAPSQLLKDHNYSFWV